MIWLLCWIQWLLRSSVGPVLLSCKREANGCKGGKRDSYQFLVTITKEIQIYAPASTTTELWASFNWGSPRFCPCVGIVFLPQKYLSLDENLQSHSSLILYVAGFQIMLHGFNKQWNISPSNNKDLNSLKIPFLLDFEKFHLKTIFDVRSAWKLLAYQYLDIWFSCQLSLYQLESFVSKIEIVKPEEKAKAYNERKYWALFFSVQSAVEL